MSIITYKSFYYSISMTFVCSTTSNEPQFSQIFVGLVIDKSEILQDLAPFFP